MSEPSGPLVIMIAGPNGAGKTTFHETFLSDLNLPFLNADILARDLHLGAYEASEQVTHMRELFLRQGRGFIAETVLSDPVGAKVEYLKCAAEAGGDVQLIFIGLADAVLSRERVADRVAAGGHDVPEDKIAQRYPRIMNNLKRAIKELPLVTLYDNSSYTHPYRFVAEYRDGNVTRRGLEMPPRWAEPFLQGAA